jgi:hypothetical protein
MERNETGQLMPKAMADIRAIPKAYLMIFLFRT